MTDHRDSEDMAEPTQSTDPMENPDSTDPIDPTDRAEPTDPMDKTEPFEAMLSSESSDHSDHRDPEVPVTPASSRVTPPGPEVTAGWMLGEALLADPGLSPRHLPGSSRRQGTARYRECRGHRGDE
jgi:hypothetical protein